MANYVLPKKQTEVIAELRAIYQDKFPNIVVNNFTDLELKALEDFIYDESSEYNEKTQQIFWVLSKLSAKKKPLTKKTKKTKKEEILNDISTEAPNNPVIPTEIQYKICIASYNRPDFLHKKTLCLLEKHNVPKNLIYIFVHNEEQLALYDFVVKNGYNVINSNTPNGLRHQREFISNFFEEGTHIVAIDDDIQEVLEIVVDNEQLLQKMTKNALDINPETTQKNIKLGYRLAPIKDLMGFFKNAFESLHKYKLSLWGIYPVNNAFFMNHSKDPTTCLTLIVGCLFGFINHRETQKLNIENKEDYERSIKHFIKDGGVLKFNNVTVKTTFYQGTGGMNNSNRWYDTEYCINKLIELYPKYCKISKPSHHIDKYTLKPYSEVKLIRLRSSITQ